MALTPLDCPYSSVCVFHWCTVLPVLHIGKNNIGRSNNSFMQAMTTCSISWAFSPCKCETLTFFFLSKYLDHNYEESRNKYKMCIVTMCPFQKRHLDWICCDSTQIKIQISFQDERLSNWINANIMAS